MSLPFQCGDQVRIQLAPDGEHFRYVHQGQSGWQDLGYGGPWVDAFVKEVYEADQLFSLEYRCPNGESQRVNLPLPGHAAYVSDIPGWPTPPQRRIVGKCDCGTQKVGGICSDWCSTNQPAANHGALAGLADDDQPQYKLEDDDVPF